MYCFPSSELISLTDIPKFNIGLDNESILSLILFIGIENPIPSIVSEASFILLIPTTSPFVLTKGPPLLPGFIAVSVWIKFNSTPELVLTVLFVALTIPAVTV